MFNRITMQEQFIAMYCQDVADNPSCYKQSVQDNPRQLAERIISGLSETEVRVMLRDLRAERRTCRKYDKNVKW